MDVERESWFRSKQNDVTFGPIESKITTRQRFGLSTSGPLEETKGLTEKQKSRILFIEHLLYAIPEAGMLHQHSQLMVQ